MPTSKSAIVKKLVDASFNHLKGYKNAVDIGSKHAAESALQSARLLGFGKKKKKKGKK